MRTTFVVLGALATMFLGAGVAQASSGTYSVGQTWWQTFPKGTPTLVPHIDDDVIEVRCHGTDQMTGWKLNDPALDAGRGGAPTAPGSRWSPSGRASASASR